MTFWVVRAGKHGENESYALEKGVAAIGWDDIGDIGTIKDRDALQQLVTETWPDESIGTTRVWTGELLAFKDRIQKDDWVALPLKSRAAIAVGRVTGPYKFVSDGPHDAKHQRPVKWLRTDLPRAEVDQDLLYSLGSTLTVFRVRRNNAEERLAAIVQGKKSPPITKATDEPESGEVESFELEQFAADQIVNYIGRKFRGTN
jgi:restriction system protein